MCRKRPSSQRRRANSSEHIFNARVAQCLPIVTVKWSEAPIKCLIRNDEPRGACQDKIGMPSYITSQLWKIRIQHPFRQILTVSSLVEGHDEVEGV
ncbi:uncharacterized protein ARMOST_20166 [Armillaria ostoyae]|uniref:Uncharacterized protein n=1 Tax=Armillaria ostoyae TaxID=47428 RepID=A0A284S6L2_ARMOS|nr:uncharacterized protein ARMOST_20166 [Armillaria ostoyae]